MLGETTNPDPPNPPLGERVQFSTPTCEPPINYCCRRLSIPNDDTWIALVNGALSTLLFPQFWIQTEIGGKTIESVNEEFAVMWLDYLGLLEMIGAVIPMCVDVLPTNMLWCDGSEYLRVDYPDLYGRLPSAFITDADHFITPDLRGRFVVGSGQGVGLVERPFASDGGEEIHVLNVDEMPVHTHADAGHTHSYTAPLAQLVNGTSSAVPGGASELPFSTTGSGNADIQNAGGGEGHNNMPPYLALRFALVAKSRDC